MDLNEIKTIIQFMDDNGLVEFEHEQDGKRIRLRRGEATPIVAAVPAAAAPVTVSAAPAPPDPNVVEFKSPLVGTFYRAPKPDADPFVDVGDDVGDEKVLCVIEAMKVMNEIKAEMSGVIKEILVKNGQAVEFGEPLFLIEKK